MNKDVNKQKGKLLERCHGLAICVDCVRNVLECCR